MRDHDETGAQLAIEFEHQAEHLLGIAAVEIAGGFIGQHQARPRHQRARHCGPLAFAARELVRAMAQAIAQADSFEQRRGALLRFACAHAPDQQRHGDVLQRREFRQQMVKLVDEADGAVAQAPTFRLIQGMQFAPVD